MSCARCLKGEDPGARVAPEAPKRLDLEVYPVNELYLDEVAVRGSSGISLPPEATLYRQKMFQLWLGPGPCHSFSCFMRRSVRERPGILCGGIAGPLS